MRIDRLPPSRGPLPPRRAGRRRGRRPMEWTLAPLSPNVAQANMVFQPPRHRPFPVAQARWPVTVTGGAPLLDSESAPRWPATTSSQAVLAQRLCQSHRSELWEWVPWGVCRAAGRAAVTGG